MEKQKEPKQESELRGVHKVVIFRPYPFRVGEKVHIEGGPRRGDWEVIGVSDLKVKLRCPISRREFEWNQFCYFTHEQEGVEWPQKHGRVKTITMV